MRDDAMTSRDRLRRLFLDASREILREPDTSLDLRKVAERAGMSRTAPYLAFGKTEEGGGLAALQLAVAAEGFGELAGRMKEGLRSSGNPEEGLRRMAAAYLGFARDETRLFRLMFGPEVSEAARSPAPPGPGLEEQKRLQEARGWTEWVLREAIAREHAGYLRRPGALTQTDLAGAVWAMLHGAAMLTIDDQWGATRLGEREDPEQLAGRVLRFLTTASSEVMKGAEEALRRALEEKEAKGEEEAPGPRRSAPEAREVRPDASLTLFSRLASHAEVEPEPDLDDGPEEFAMREPASPYPAAPIADAPARSPAPKESSVLRRARASHHLIEGARILWIDDRPARAVVEAEVFRELRASVTWASGKDEALEELGGRSPGEGFQVIVSDIARGGRPDAGVRDLPEILKAAPGVPVIFYVAELRPELGVPRGAFGITNDPEELVHLVFDGLERGVP
jgi:AcrR family transcriptional regulator